MSSDKDKYYMISLYVKSEKQAKLIDTEQRFIAVKGGTWGMVEMSRDSQREGNGNPLQYSCLENPMDKGAWWATVHGVAKSQTRLSD